MAAASAGQQGLALTRAFALLPWDQDGGAAVLTELDALRPVHPPPDTIRVRDQRPIGATQVFRIGLRTVTVRIERDDQHRATLELMRHPWRDEQGECFVYLPDEVTTTDIDRKE